MLLLTPRVDHPLLAQAVGQLAAGQFDAAQDTLQAIWQQAQASQSSTLEAAALIALAALWREQGQVAESLKYLSWAQEPASACGDLNIAGHMAAALGVTLTELGDEDALAIEALMRALHLAQHTGDVGLQAGVRIHHAQLLVARGHAPAAFDEFNAGYQLAHTAGMPLLQSAASMGLARVAQTLGDAAQARRWLEVALDHLPRAAHPLRRADVFIALGEVSWRQGDAGGAVALLESALESTQGLTADALKARLHALLADVHEARGDAPRALTHLRAHVAHQRQVHGVDTRRRVRRMLASSDAQPWQREAELARRDRDELALALEAAQAAERRQRAALAELHQQTDLLRQQAREDSLTGLANRGWLDEQLARECERARRYKHAVSVAMIDIDHFKRVNDSCSHAVGDEVLRRVGRLLRASCRSADVVGRYGGEEFIVVLPETPIAQAEQVCEKLRKRIESLRVGDLHPALQAITASIGVAGEAQAPIPVNLVQAADAALYRAKHSGRNRVVLAPQA